LQRKCACGSGSDGPCSECRDEEERVQRQSAGPGGPVTAPPIVHEVVRSPGRTLDLATRALMETRFGHDFSRVRVHTDARAAESARRVNARAYTVGQHIAFDHGQYNNDTPEGLRLMAHELAHTVQQGVDVSLQRAGDLTVAPANDALEREADSAAGAAMEQRHADVHEGARLAVLQRTPWGVCPAGTEFRGTKAFPEVYEPAERRVVQYYITSKGGDLVFSNYPSGEVGGTGRYYEYEGEDQFIAYYRDRFLGKEHKLPGQRVTSRVQGGTEVPADEEREAAAREFAAGPAPGYYIFEPTKKQPDLLDFGNHTVWDVTSERNAGNKKAKIGQYVEQLNHLYDELKDYPEYNTRVDAKHRRRWSAGVSLAKPGPQDYLFPTPDFPNVYICYGPTDLQAAHGVIAYRPIATPPGWTPDQAAAQSPDRVPLVLHAGGIDITLQVNPKGKATPIPENDPVNGSVAASLFGMRIVGVGADHRTIEVERVQAAPNRARFRTAQKIELIRQNDGRLTAKPHSKNRFFVRGLSEAELTLSLDDQGLSGEGPLHTSVSILKNAPIVVRMHNEQVSVNLEGNPEKIRSPIPGLKITQASVGATIEPELTAQGTLGVAFGSPKKPLADGVLTVSADADGLVVDGKIDVHIPGVDQAEGHITYRDGHLTGTFTISTEQLRGPLPGVTGASLTGGFNDQGISLEGSLSLNLPGDQPATLSVKKKGDHFVYTGEATFAVPGINPVKATVSYDGEHFQGSGETGFDIQGLHGTIKATYRDGKISGTGKAGIEKGRVKGEIGVTLHEDNTLTGAGTVTVQITDNLVGTVGVALDANKKVHVKGAIEFPKPITLFDRFPRAQKDQDKELFKLSQDIGIPGLSIGTIGVVAHIGARLGVSYYVGPGELRDVKLEAGFDPLEEAKNLSVQGHAALVIPAHAGVYLVLEGGLGVSAAGFAEVTGGLTVRGDAGLDGGLESTVDIDYHDGRFAVDAEAAIRAGLSLRLALGAYIDAHVGIGPLQAGWRKDWELKAYVWNGPSFSVVFPLHYASDEPFQAPSLDQIRFEKLNVDVKGLLGNVFGSSQSSEKPGPA